MPTIDQQKDFILSMESEPNQRELFSETARGSRDRMLWPLVSIPKGVVILYPAFLVFLTDQEPGISTAKRVLTFTTSELANRFLPFYRRIAQITNALGLKSFDREKALENPLSFFIALSDVSAVKGFWKATHGGIVEVGTLDGRKFYLYQDMHSTNAFSYWVRGGWRWHKRLAGAVKHAAGLPVNSL
jgi:hypothetical protein